MRAKSSAIVLVALCGTLSLLASGEAEAARRQRDVKEARPAFSDPSVRSVAVGIRDLQTPEATARLSGSRRGIALAAAIGRRERAYAAAAEPGGISCVPYARLISGIQVTGNGGTWWDNAAGLYDRGQSPAPGSVLAFRSSGGMSMGHVAVVQRTVSAREIKIEHANWAGPGMPKGQILRDVSVVDVSDRNDWTEVRVEVGRGSGSYGRVYPTYGFIHNHPEAAPDRGAVRLAAGSARYQEVAEAPAAPRVTLTPRPAPGRGIDLSLGGPYQGAWRR